MARWKVVLTVPPLGTSGVDIMKKITAKAVYGFC
ncbi:MAG: hypothetical protein Ct9H90mP25_4230 [Gammaproteobacteria bacterium]|nr:MAG: hypothetical protein Ct9H90mP25_4230 [Gammaproteobacteria bacterium]